MSPGPYWWTWSLAPWTASGVDLSDRSSDQTTSCLDRVEQGITGQKDITLKVGTNVNCLLYPNESWFLLHLLLNIDLTILPIVQELN